MSQLSKDAIRSKILAKYFTVTKCASELHWTRQRLSDTINGGREPTLQDIIDMSKALDTPLLDLIEFFYPNASTNDDGGV